MSRAKNPKYESMSLEEVKANMEKSRQELEAAIHNKNLLEQRKKLVERRERSHRLIVKGAEFEKAFPLSRDLEQEEFQEVMNQMRNSSYNKIHDYTSKSGVIFTEILTPEYVPERLTDRETLWNEVEHVERNNKAQLAYSSDIALQNELTLEENIKLAKEFCQEQFVARDFLNGLGVIENDFHDRKDLTPNVCAVYTEKEYRGKGIAGHLLGMAVENLKAKGLSPVYLLTEHVGYYERYGWEYYRNFLTVPPAMRCRRFWSIWMSGTFSVTL